MHETITSRKRVIWHPLARKTLIKLDRKIISKLEQIINVLSLKGYLKQPDAKKITNEIFEIRIRIKGAWRVFYCYSEADLIIILHIFQKKQNKTPLNDLETAKNRLKNLNLN